MMIDVNEMSEKELKAMFGDAGGPIPATKVLVKDMKFDDPNTEAKSWIFINEVDGTRIHANSYNGGLGKKYKPQVHDLPAEGDKAWKKKIKDYAEIDLDECHLVAAKDFEDEDDDA